MPTKRVDYEKFLTFIKKNSPCLTKTVHNYLERESGIINSTGRSIAISRLVKRGLIARDNANPNGLIRYLEGN